jgi:hypothetical protein
MKWLKLGLGAALVGGLAMTVQMAFSGPVAGALEGRWGGDRLQLVVESGVGRVELDCASGTITGPIRLTEAGKFDAPGTFQQHQGGPQRADEGAGVANARYSGEVREGVMKLSVLPDGSSTPQVFNLRKGVSVKLVRCL